MLPIVRQRAIGNGTTKVVIDSSPLATRRRSTALAAIRHEGIEDAQPASSGAANTTGKKPTTGKGLHKLHQGSDRTEAALDAAEAGLPVSSPTIFSNATSDVAIPDLTWEPIIG